MKILQWIIAPLIMTTLAAIAATFILYQLIALTPSGLPMNTQAKPASYTEWLFGGYGSRGVVNGDFGDSIMQKRPAADLVQASLPASLELFIPTVWQSLLFGILLGILLSVLRRWLTDGFLRPVVWLGIAVPTFWLALMLIIIYAIHNKEFPMSGRCGLTIAGDCPPVSERLEYLMLPLRALVIHWTYLVAMAIRTALVPLLQQDTKGKLKRRYLLDGVLVPILVLLPSFMAGVISTQILIEMVFAWPGVGRLVVQGAMSRDLPVITAVLVQVVLWLIAVFFVATVLNGIIGMLRSPNTSQPNPAEKPQPQTDMLAPEPVGAFDEPRADAVSLRPLIDKLYTVLAIIATVILLGIGLVTLQPSLVSSADPLQMNPADRLLLPGAEGHPYGTDELGRDFQARLLAAGQNTLKIAFLGTLVALVIGGIIGFVGGLFMDSIGVLLNIPINALIIGLNLLPTLPLLLLIAGVVPPNESNLAIILGLVNWENVALTVRTKVASSIAGSKASGSWPLVLVYALAFNMAVIVGIESSLSFLGFGVQPPAATLGSLLANAFAYMTKAEHLVVIPGLIITLIAVCLHIIASRAQDAGTFPSVAPAKTEQ